MALQRRRARRRACGGYPLRTVGRECFRGAPLTVCAQLCPTPRARTGGRRGLGWLRESLLHQGTVACSRPGSGKLNPGLLVGRMKPAATSAVRLT